MNRAQLEHLIRAAGAVCGEEELVILGSQAILGTIDTPPQELVQSMEVDTYPLKAPGKAHLIDGAIGELSPFHEQFQYYAHGVGPETAILPAHWRSRWVALRNHNTGGVTGWCLGPDDLALSKLVAGRAKDISFVEVMLRHSLVTRESLATAAEEMDPPYRSVALDRIHRLP